MGKRSKHAPTRFNRYYDNHRVERQLDSLQRYHENRDENVLKMRERNWKVAGLDFTLEDYEKLLEAQGGVCAICGIPPTPKRALCVDHCHSTGKVRGLLCTKCNRTLGQYGDNPVLLRRMAQYLEQ